MLPRNNRIPKNLFPLLKKNKLVEGEVFSLRITFNSEEEKINKFVCVISKKTEKLAVKRNKMKRQVYSIILESSNIFDKSFYLQIFPKKEAFKKNFSDLKTELEEILKKI